MNLSTFTEKFNKIEGNSYTFEEEVTLTNGVYVGYLEHDNVVKESIAIYTGSGLTGTKIKNYFLSSPSLAPWRYQIKVYATDIEKAYISYETTGDQVEADDINLLQTELVRTQEALNVEEDRAVKKENELEKLIGNKVDKEEGKGLSTNDYTDEEKKKLDSAYNYMIPYVIATGEADNYIVEIEEVTEYKEPLALTLKINVDNTGVSTININNLGAKTILNSNGDNLQEGDLKADIPYTLRYNGLNFILQTKGGGSGIDTSDATIQNEDVLTGKIAYGPNGKVEGSMVDNSAIEVTLDSNNKEYIIPRGFHNGLGKIKAVITNLIASVIKYGSVVGGITGTFTGDATATASQMLSGAIAYVKGNKVTGNIASQGAQTITPGTTNKTIAAGKYLSGVQTIKGDSNLIASNIISGKSIFGVAGTATISSLGGSKIEKGSINHIKGTGDTIKLSFTPTIIYVYLSSGIHYAIVPGVKTHAVGINYDTETPLIYFASAAINIESSYATLKISYIAYQ